jgi:Bacterial DNA-binding protein
VLVLDCRPAEVMQ